MKVIFALALLLSCMTGFLMAGDHEEAGKIFEGCMSENGVSMQDLQDLKAGKTKPEDAKDNVKCLTQCVFVKLGFMDVSGKLLSDQILKYFPEASQKASLETAIAACADVVGANPCDTSYQMMICFEKHGSQSMTL